MSIGAGLGQGLMFAANQIANRKQAERKKANELELFNLERQAEQQALQQQQQRELDLLRPLQIKKGTKKEKRELAQGDLMPFQNLKTGQEEMIDRAGAEQKLAMLNSLEGAVPASAVKQRDKLQAFLSGNPQYETVETPEYYSPEELMGYKQLGVLGSLMQQNKKEGEQTRAFQALEADTTLSPEQKQAIKASLLAGSGGASLAREFYINPYEQAGVEYRKQRTKDIETDNKRADQKAQNLEAYRQTRLAQRQPGAKKGSTPKSARKPLRRYNSEKGVYEFFDPNTGQLLNKGKNKAKPEPVFNYTPKIEL